MHSDAQDSIARRTVHGSFYSIGSSGVTIVLGFVRAVLLARLLLPEHFGVVALALFFLNFASQIRSFGFDSALIHRKNATEPVFATYFVLRSGLALATSLLLVLLIPVISRFYPDMPLLAPVLLAYVGIGVIQDFNAVQVTVLNKQLAFQHLALTNVLSSIAMTIVAPYLAWQGWGVWSLVAERFTGIIVRALSIWVFYRAWRPRLGWDTETVRWFWSYGAKIWMSSNLSFLLDRFDDFWVGTFLGQTPLGYYSKAYEFAGYPRRAIANPVVSVFFPTFAHLQDEPVRLARAFFRLTSVVLRFGFWFSLIFVLSAPEFIRVFIGERWLPMVVTFQLMIVYTLFDPLAIAATRLLLAIGQPGLVVRAHIAQAAVFLPGVAILGYLAGIEGVAVAADAMLFTGTILLFYYSRRFINYSMHALWTWPSVACACAAAITLGMGAIWAPLPDWMRLIGKGLTVTLVYWPILLLTERQQLVSGFKMIWNLIRPRLKQT